MKRAILIVEASDGSNECYVIEPLWIVKARVRGVLAAQPLATVVISDEIDPKTGMLIQQFTIRMKAP